MTNLMVGGYPRDELWRLWSALFVLAAALGFGAGAIGAQRRREVAEGRALSARRRAACGGSDRCILLVVVLLWLGQSFEALVARRRHLRGRRSLQRDRQADAAAALSATFP